MSDFDYAAVSPYWSFLIARDGCSDRMHEPGQVALSRSQRYAVRSYYDAGLATSSGVASSAVAGVAPSSGLAIPPVGDSAGAAKATSSRLSSSERPTANTS